MGRKKIRLYLFGEVVVYHIMRSSCLRLRESHTLRENSILLRLWEDSYTTLVVDTQDAQKVVANPGR